jgi:DNA-directed RNA polymerase subunit RPC12/RpoP
MNQLKTTPEITPESTAATPAPQEKYVFEHSTCAMCDSTLEIRHEINKNEFKIKEEAHCPSCGIRVRSTHHLMQ